jgi:hypothetical protein
MPDATSAVNDAGRDAVMKEKEQVGKGEEEVTPTATLL